MKDATGTIPVTKPLVTSTITHERHYIFRQIKPPLVLSIAKPYGKLIAFSLPLNDASGRPKINAPHEEYSIIFLF
jgi:hypothetical protein